VVAVARLSPVLIRLCVATFGAALRGFGVTGRLAAAHLTSSARRLSPVVSALVLAVALGGSLWFLPTSQEHVAAAQRRAGLLADLVVTPAAPGLQAGQLAAIGRTGGVLAATGVTHSTMFVSRDGATATVQGVDPIGLARTIDLAVTSGTLADLRGRTIAVDTLTAQALHARVGDEFHGWFGDGAPAVLRIVAIYRRGLGFAELTAPRDVLSPHTTTSVADTVFVTTTAAARRHVEAALRAELGRFAPGSSVLARDEYQAELDKDLAANGWTSQIIVGVMLVYVVIAAVNTLVMAALARRRELAILRLTGVTRIQVLRMVRLEQALLVGLAMVVGGAIAVATLVPMVKGTTGTATPYIPPGGWAAVVGGTVLLAGAATMLPVRRVLRMRPVEAIGIRE
jgi:putative ABC transport system permease protein